MNYRPIALLLLLYVSSAFSNDQTSETETVFPQKMSAQELLYKCNASAMTSMGRGRGKYCTGFISGVEEAARFVQSGDKQKVCMPANVSSRKLKDVYTRYALQNKQLLNKPAAEIVLLALRSAYPCTGDANTGNSG